MTYIYIYMHLYVYVGSAGKRVALGDIATAALNEHADALGEIQWAEQLGRPTTF